MTENNEIDEVVETVVPKSKYLIDMAKYLNFTHLGASFWGAQLYCITNKDDPTSKVLYVFELENGSKIEFVNIYDGSVCKINNYHKMGFNIRSGTNYQRDIALDLIFASFVNGIKISEKTKGVVYTYYPNNIVKPVEGMFKLGDFELYVQSNRVELFIPNFDRRVIGDYKKIPMTDCPNIQWHVDTKTNKKPFFLMEEDEFFD